MATAFAVSAAPQAVDFDKLPKNSQEFVQKNFPNEKIKSVEMDRQSSWDKYTVYFNSGNQVSFEGGSGDCSQIIMKNGSIPATALPSKVRNYVAGKYPSQNITMWGDYQRRLQDRSVGQNDDRFRQGRQLRQDGEIAALAGRFQGDRSDARTEVRRRAVPCRMANAARKRARCRSRDPHSAPANAATGGRCDTVGRPLSTGHRSGETGTECRSRRTAF